MVNNNSHGRRVIFNERISILTTEDPALIETRRRGWYIATGTTVHVCNSRDMFEDYQPLTNHVVKVEGSDDYDEVAGVGTVVLRFTTGKVLTLSDVFHMPTIIKCILSFVRLAKCSLTFDENGVVIEDANSRQIIGKGYKEDGGLLRLSLMNE